MTSRRQMIAGAAAWGLLAGRSRAQDRGQHPSTYPLLAAPPPSHRTDQLDLEVDGRGYRLFRALPSQTGATAVLWMLDGNASFARMPAELLAQHPALAVIFVGYQADAGLAGSERTLDYTPPLPPGRVEPRVRGREIGGDALFRSRLTGPLRQAAERGLSVPDNRRALWGHSFGGLFTLGTLFADPPAFGRYIAVSPSLWFGGGLLAEAEAQAGPADADVLMMAGDREGPGAAQAIAPPAMVAMAERLAQRDGLRVTWETMRGMGHGETLQGSFARTLGFAA